jgi:hypothetical protein
VPKVLAVCVLALWLVAAAWGQQGGDTLATATPILALPFDATGTTVGFNDDYDETCPYSGSTSPDVVYALNPGQDLRARISLCHAETDYDTKLYVYAGHETHGFPYACNDDYCDLASELTDVALTSGQIYYIVIDGYGGQAGTYRLTATEIVPETCPDGSLYSQVISAPNSAVPSDVGASRFVADNFTLSAGQPVSICSVRFWGLQSFDDGSGWQACEEPDPTFTITVYGSSGSAPNYADVVYQITDAPAAVTATSSLFEGATVLRFDVALVPCWELQPQTAYWLEIIGTGASETCWFLWLNETSTAGDGHAYRRGGIPPTLNFDMSFCLAPAGPTTCPSVLGDVNGDGVCNNFDITPFVFALTHSEADFAVRYPGGHYWCADCNQDGAVNNFDITPFVHVLIGQ